MEERMITVNIYNYSGEVVDSEQVEFKKFLIMKHLNRVFKDKGLKPINIDLRKTIDELNKNEGLMIKSVIVSDDEAILREAYVDTLTRLCHYVESFSTADEALKTFQEEPDRYDVILTDNNMPESVLSGGQFAKKVKAISSRVKVHIITGEVSSVDKDVFDHNVDNTISKPLNEYTFAITLGKGKFIRNDKINNVININERRRPTNVNDSEKKVV